MGRYDIIHELSKLYTIPLALLAAPKHRILGEHIYEAIAETIDNYTDDAVKYKIEPGDISKVDMFDKVDDVAIVMQGAIKNGFTYETLKAYRKFFPQAPIVLSTWTDENDTIIKKIESLGIEVVRSECPEVVEVGNHINYQIKSSLEGIKKIEQYGVKYVLKTRTDHRISRPTSLSALKSLLSAFPLKGNYGCMQKRLVFIGGFLSARYMPFHICDQLNFGTVNDMKNYWSVAYMKNPIGNIDFEGVYAPLERFEHANIGNIMENIDEQYKSAIEFGMEHVAEMYLAINFYNSYIESVDVKKESANALLKRYHNFLRDCIILINPGESFGFWWPKYHYKYKEMNQFEGMRGLDFYEWLKFYNGDV